MQTTCGPRSQPTLVLPDRLVGPAAPRPDMIDQAGPELHRDIGDRKWTEAQYRVLSLVRRAASSNKAGKITLE